MTSGSIEESLTSKIAEHLPDAAPGLRLQVHYKGRKNSDIALGQTYPCYDLASLTKIIFTVPALMAAYEKGLWRLETKVIELWPTFPVPEVTLTQLLTHTSGALWWYPFYRKVDFANSRQARRDWLKRKIEKLEWKPGGVCVYSDVGMLVLGVCLEAMHRTTLLEIWHDLKTDLYSTIPGLAFHEGNRPSHPRAFYAPTEQCEWRARLLQGEVHDDNAWSFGGISSHAGLFGGIDDVSAYGLVLRANFIGGSETFFKRETLKLFTNRAFPPSVGNWGMGFMVPAPTGAACGNRFSRNAFGHTGFTGTSIWYDPEADVLVTVLSNRVLLGRDRKNFRDLMPAVHDWIMDDLSNAEERTARQPIRTRQ